MQLISVEIHPRILMSLVVSGIKWLMQQTYTYHTKVDKSPVYIAQNFWDWWLIIFYHGIAMLIRWYLK